MGFSRQEYWSVLPFPFPGDLCDPGIELMAPAKQADSLLLSHWGAPIVKKSGPQSKIAGVLMRREVLETDAYRKNM